MADFPSNVLILGERVTLRGLSPFSVPIMATTRQLERVSGQFGGGKYGVLYPLSVAL